MLGAICGAAAWTGRLAAADAEPFAITFRVLGLRLSPAAEWAAAPAALALAALVLGASLFSARFYCRHLCGAGAVLRLLAGAGARAEERPPILEAGEESRNG
jgi:polyferredoxin